MSAFQEEDSSAPVGTPVSPGVTMVEDEVAEETGNRYSMRLLHVDAAGKVWRLHVRVENPQSNKRVVMLHGLHNHTNNPAFSHHIQNFVKDGYAVYAIDLPNHGLSGGPGENRGCVGDSYMPIVRTILRFLRGYLGVGGYADTTRIPEEIRLELNSPSVHYCRDFLVPEAPEPALVEPTFLTESLGVTATTSTPTSMFTRLGEELGLISEKEVGGEVVKGEGIFSPTRSTASLPAVDTFPPPTAATATQAIPIAPMGESSAPTLPQGPGKSLMRGEVVAASPMSESVLMEAMEKMKIGKVKIGMENEGKEQADGEEAYSLAREIERAAHLPMPPPPSAGPVIFFGESMGGLIGLHAVTQMIRQTLEAETQEKSEWISEESAGARGLSWLAGVVFVAPCVELGGAGGIPFVQSIMTGAAYLAPRTRLARDEKIYYKNPEMHAKQVEEPFVDAGITLLTAHNLANNAALAPNAADYLKVPTMIIHGEEDEVVEMEGSAEVFHRAMQHGGSLSLIVVPEGLHNLLYDLGHGEELHSQCVSRNIGAFLGDRFSGGGVHPSFFLRADPRKEAQAGGVAAFPVSGSLGCETATVIVDSTTLMKSA